MKLYSYDIRTANSDANIVRFVEELCELIKHEMFVKPMEFIIGPGSTIMVPLIESHVIVHTYPEKNMVFLDIFTCKEIEVAQAFLVGSLIIKTFSWKDHEGQVFEPAYHQDVMNRTHV